MLATTRSQYATGSSGNPLGNFEAGGTPIIKRKPSTTRLAEASEPSPGASPSCSTGSARKRLLRPSFSCPDLDATRSLPVHLAPDEAYAQGEEEAEGSWSGRLSTRGHLAGTLRRRQPSRRLQDVLPPEKRGQLNAFRRSLEEAGLDTERFGRGNAKSLEMLFYEVEKQTCTLEQSQKGPLKRVVHQLQITLVATLDGIEHVLVSLTQVLHDRRAHSRKQLLLHKLTIGEEWTQGLQECLMKRLHVKVEDQKKMFCVDTQSYNVRQEEEMSRGYPGLTTRYCLHEVVVYVENPLDPDMERLGLPEARSFSTMEGAIGTCDVKARLNVWSWEHATALLNQGILTADRFDNLQEKTQTSVARTLSQLRRMALISEEELSARVPTPQPLAPKQGTDRAPNALLTSLISGEKLDTEAAARAAGRIRDPHYDLRRFFDDCSSAFPEVRLYLGAGVEEPELTSSGRSTDDEYQRTVGALFAVYWLMRLDIDGKDGFCFGVDQSWKVVVPSSPSVPCTKPFGKMSKQEKRNHFRATGPWDAFEELLLDAGLFVRGPAGDLEAPVERTKAMLALTAVHDIMKVESLVPQVAAQHAPFSTYKEQEEIGDHDLALAYLLEHYPQLVPSVNGLAEQSQSAVLFTQSKMEFNNGWLVQAEAPPGRLLRVFKQVLSRSMTTASPRSARRLSPRSSERVSQQDVAFYFVHWLTDLAGAVPVPLSGSEKFVVQFPHELLGAFLKSFRILKHLVQQDETTVFENYLRMRWEEQRPQLPPIEENGGPEAVCKARLLCMAQGAAPQVLEAFMQMSPKERHFLSFEMTLTGRAEQVYKLCKDVPEVKVGPAFLVYYGPALLQQSGAQDPELALQILVAIFRAGRELWPGCAAAADETVTLRIDTLKDQSKESLRKSTAMGEVWMLVYHTAHEGFVERHPVHVLNDFNRAKKAYQVLSLLTAEQLGEKVAKHHGKLG